MSKKPILKKSETKAEEIFQKIAGSGKSVGALHPHASYEEEMQKRSAKRC